MIGDEENSYSYIATNGSWVSIFPNEPILDELTGRQVIRGKAFAVEVTISPGQEGERKIRLLDTHDTIQEAADHLLLNLNYLRDGVDRDEQIMEATLRTVERARIRHAGRER